MLYLTEDDVVRFLAMRDCIGLMRTVFEQLASGEAINQPRRRLILPAHSVLHYMAAGNARYFGCKVYSTHPRHGATFLLLLYRAEDAALLAVMEANRLGQIRTGAASGLATALLARPDARTAAIIGSGFQARTQLEAIGSVIKFENVRVWSRSREKRSAFAAESAERLNVNVEPADSPQKALADADVVVTATNAAKPVIESAWIAPGAHINAIGSNQAKRRELPTDLVRRAGLIAVDSREQARMESGDLLLGLDEAHWERVVELRDVVTGKAGRSAQDEITLFKSNGLAVEDVAAAGLVYERAVEAGAGRPLYS